MQTDTERIERCFLCDDATGRAGKAEDSLYNDDDGPFCLACYTIVAAYLSRSLPPPASTPSCTCNKAPRRNSPMQHHEPECELRKALLPPASTPVRRYTESELKGLPPPEGGYKAPAGVVMRPDTGGSDSADPVECEHLRNPRGYCFKCGDTDPEWPGPGPDSAERPAGECDHAAWHHKGAGGALVCKGCGLTTDEHSTLQAMNRVIEPDSADAPAPAPGVQDVDEFCQEWAEKTTRITYRDLIEARDRQWDEYGIGFINGMTEKHDARIARLEEALRGIASEHQDYDLFGPAKKPGESQYSIGVTDGHRCAAAMARKALENDATTD